jgi:hypothetical protein
MRLVRHAAMLADRCGRSASTPNTVPPAAHMGTGHADNLSRSRLAAASVSADVIGG